MPVGGSNRHSGRLVAVSLTPELQIHPYALIQVFLLFPLFFAGLFLLFLSITIVHCSSLICPCDLEVGDYETASCAGEVQPGRYLTGSLYYQQSQPQSGKSATFSDRMMDSFELD
jgi:hypothetical protein